MSDVKAIVEALAFVRDRIVVAIADVERDDHLRAADEIEKATIRLRGTIKDLRAA